MYLPPLHQVRDVLVPDVQDVAGVDLGRLPVGAVGDLYKGAGRGGVGSAIRVDVAYSRSPLTLAYAPSRQKKDPSPPARKLQAASRTRAPHLPAVPVHFAEDEDVQVGLLHQGLGRVAVEAAQLAGGGFY